MVKRYIKRLKNLPVEYKDLFIEIISKIELGDFSNLDISPLKGKLGFYRCRVGKFRIIFYKDIDGDYRIDDIGSRGDIYK